MSEYNQQFDSFEQWVNKASSWLTRRGSMQQAVCYDAKGRICTRGEHMRRARDEDAFPIRWVWPDDGLPIVDPSLSNVKNFVEHG